MTQSCVLVGCGPRFYRGSDDTCVVVWVAEQRTAERKLTDQLLLSSFSLSVSLTARQPVSGVSHGVVCDAEITVL